MIGRTNTGGGGSGGTLTVTAPAGVTVTVSKDGKTKTKVANSSGVAVFKGLATGEWTLVITDGDRERSQLVTITADYSTVIAFFAATINITYPAGSTCTATDSVTTLNAPDTSGVWACVVPNTGTWTVSCTDGIDSANRTVEIMSDGQTESIALSYNQIPDFTYTGDYEIVNDADEPITVSEDNWKIRFLTSGTLNITSLNGAENGIDVFLVGGGARGSAVSNHSTGVGGGGGYTRTISKISLTTTSQYEIVIGGQGGDSSAFGYIAAAGCTGKDGYTGGNGGSGGGGYSNKGGTDGNNGGGYSNKGVGYGQRNLAGPNGETGTTREFGESDGKLYSKGGDGITGTPSDPIANTGNGGDGSSSVSGAGSSGIIIIRNAREVS